MTQKQKDLWGSPEAMEGRLTRQCAKKEFRPDDFVGGRLFLVTG